MKNKIEIEYVLNSTSISILWNSIGNPLGLAEWFADCVKVSGEEYTFSWGDSDQIAILKELKQNSHIRFKWKEDTEPDYYFELKIIQDALSLGLTLLVTDFTEDSDVENLKLLWNQQIEILRRKRGF